jgi:hypothetical protein
MHFPGMTRYFFNLYNDDTALDAEGVEFPDIAAACAHARIEARYMAADSVRNHGHLVKRHHISVTTEAGEEVAVVRFGDVVEIIM